MSDTPHPDPLDEQASDLFDAGTDAPGDEPELGARLDEYRALRDALADVPPAPDTQRDGAIAAALALFDELGADAPTESTTESPDAAPTVVTPLRPTAPPTSGRPRRTLAILTAAASVVVVLGVVALVTRNTGRSEVDSPSAAVAPDGGGGFSQAKSTGDEAPATESGSATAGDTNSTAAAAASTAATSAPTTSARAAGSAAGATTTAAASGGLTTPQAAEPTSTTDGRDVTTTTGFSASTTSPPTTTSTNVDAGALPYLGELTKLDDLSAALQALPPFDAADAGAPIRAQLASGVCDLRPYGTPLAVLRWNGRDSVVLRSADAPIVQLIPLDGCNPIVQLDAPS